jgi:hypothetical protein
MLKEIAQLVRYITLPDKHVTIQLCLSTVKQSSYQHRYSSARHGLLCEEEQATSRQERHGKNTSKQADQLLLASKEIVGKIIVRGHLSHEQQS